MMSAPLHAPRPVWRSASGDPAGPLPTMPEDWNFVPGPLHDRDMVSPAMTMLAIATNVLEHQDRRSGGLCWSRAAARIRLRWAADGRHRHVPILEAFDDTRDDHEPSFELHMPWSPVMGSEHDADPLAFAMRMIVLGKNALACIASATYEPHGQAEGVFDATHAALGAAVVDPTPESGTFVLRLPTPWSPARCHRNYALSSKVVTSREQEEAIASVSPKIVEISAYLFDQSGKTALSIAPVSWVGRRDFDPVRALRALADMPSAFREAFA